MDDLDHRLLTLMRDDARRSIASLAAELDASRATVRARLDKLVRSGVIGGFTIVVRDPTERNYVRAIMLIEVEGRGVEKVMRRMHGFPEVRRLYSTNGRWDIVAELVTDTLEGFDRLLNRVREIDGITSTETSILLSSSKDLV
ncbi:MAG TPA: Lrp/AsnC family transcriptional regulator [Hyphomicrobium sp.]|jgi:DNA-binding Lrp family transcriptional regulator